LALTLGLAACGGGDSSSATTEAAPPGQSQGKSSAAGESAERFVPKPHQDSGGGSAQFRVKGGDNSVQEFGDEAGDSEFEQAAADLHGFLDARAGGAWQAACSYVSKGIVDSFKQLAGRAKQGQGTNCAAVLETLTSPAVERATKAEADGADVGSLRVEGERGFLLYRGVGGTVFAMPMANEGGAWKVAALAGTPLS
jgi:hypothetical protein